MLGGYWDGHSPYPLPKAKGYYGNGWGYISFTPLKVMTMAQLLKRWESPRRQGRNDKGKGGTARQRQLLKRTQTLRQRLKDSPNSPDRGRDQGSISSLFY